MRRRSTRTPAYKPSKEEVLAPKLAHAAGGCVLDHTRTLRAAYNNAPALSLPSFADVCPWIEDVLRYGKQVFGENTTCAVYGALVDNLFEYSEAYETVAEVRIVAAEIRMRWESAVQRMVFSAQHSQLMKTLVSRQPMTEIDSRGTCERAPKSRVALNMQPYNPHAEAAGSYRIALDVISMSPLRSTASAGGSAHNYSSIPTSPFAHYSTAPLYPRPEFAEHPAVVAVAAWQQANIKRAVELYRAAETLLALFWSNRESSAYSVLQAIPGLRATIESIGVNTTGDNFLPVRGRDKYDIARLRAHMPDYAERWVEARGILAAAALANASYERRADRTYMTPAIPVAFPVVYEDFSSVSPV